MKEGGLAVVGLIAASVVSVSQFAGAEVLVNSSQHSFLESEALQAVMATSDPVPADEIPRLGAFYSAKYGVNGPPMPSSMGFAAWDLGDGDFLVDDLDEDNPTLLAGSSTGMVAMALMSGPPSPGGDGGTNSGGGYPQANYTPITNGLRFLTPVISGTTAYLSIAGGVSNGVYDVFYTTNLTESNTWRWLDRGASGQTNFTFSGMGTNQEFFVLGTMETASNSLFTTAYCHLVLGGNSTNALGDGIPDSWKIANGLSLTGNIGSDDPDGDGYNNYYCYTHGLNPRQTMVFCWGQDYSGQCDVPSGLGNAVSVTGGFDFSLALLDNGKAIAWGSNGNGQTNIPAGCSNLIAVAAGTDCGMGLRTDGTVAAWGSWWASSNYPAVSVPSYATNLKAISVGMNHALGLRKDGTVIAWGYYGTNEPYGLVPAGLSNVAAVAAGWYHNVALLSNGTVRAWGYNFSSLGWNMTNVPANLSNVTSIAAGACHTLALKSDGTVVAWGAGNSPTNVYWADLGQSIVPSGLGNVVAVSAGGYHSMALLGDGTIVTWGDLDEPVGGQGQFCAIGSGGQHGLAIRAGRLTPVFVTTPTDMSVKVSAPVIFSAYALALASVQYQWQFDGVNISGATNSTLWFVPSAGDYSIIASNAAGATTSGVWHVTTTNAAWINPGTLAYHLSTNLAARTNGYTDITNAQMMLSNWTYGIYTNSTMALLTNAVWNTNCWLHDVKGLSAICIGISNNLLGTGLWKGRSLTLTMISPRHYIRARHTGVPGGAIVFLDTNNVVYYRTSVEQVQLDTDGHKDISIGILDADLPSSVGYLPMLPDNFANYVPTGPYDLIQGLGVNQFDRIFAQPVSSLASGGLFSLSPEDAVCFGVNTNWNATLINGDSSSPLMVLINTQLLFLGTTYNSIQAESVVWQVDAINNKMHYLSTNNGATTDYRATQYAFSNWPTIY